MKLKVLINNKIVYTTGDSINNDLDFNPLNDKLKIIFNPGYTDDKTIISFNYSNEIDFLGTNKKLKTEEIDNCYQTYSIESASPLNTKTTEEITIKATKRYIVIDNKIQEFDINNCFFHGLDLNSFFLLIDRGRIKEYNQKGKKIIIYHISHEGVRINLKK